MPPVTPVSPPVSPPVALTAVDATNFGVTYLGTVEAADDAEIQAASALTCAHVAQIAFQPYPGIKGYRCNVVAPPTGLPLQLGFNATAIFDAAFATPSVDDINLAISAAFIDATVAPLLQRLQELPDANPFSATTGLEFVYSQ
jgi:hypothetical protein